MTAACRDLTNVTIERIHTLGFVLCNFSLPDCMAAKEDKPAVYHCDSIVCNISAGRLVKMMLGMIMLGKYPVSNVHMPSWNCTFVLS